MVLAMASRKILLRSAATEPGYFLQKLLHPGVLAELHRTNTNVVRIKLLNRWIS